MRQIRQIAYVLIFCILLCCGCSKTDATNDTDLASKMEEEDDLLKQSMGTVVLGFSGELEDGYTYTGQEMNVPLYLGAKENTEDMTVGALLFLNGEVQPFSYDMNGERSEEKLVHFFTLGPDETIDITAHVTPISGQQGDIVGMHFALIFKPNYMPDKDGNTSFGNCGRISSTTYIPVNMQVSGKNETIGNTVETEVTDIPDDLRAMSEGLVANDTDNVLDYMPNFDIVTEDQKNCLFAENGKLNLTLRSYGGKEVTEDITFFVNNEPVKVDGYDYLEIKTTTDKMTTFNVSLDVSGCDEINSLYAVAVEKGEDYLIQDDILQTNRFLMINE